MIGLMRTNDYSLNGNNPPPPPSLPPPHQSPIPIAISRVNQVDAGRLEIEMSAMLKEQLVKVFSLMKPGMLFQYEPELDTFLEFLIWRFFIWVDKPTPGNALMNLRYGDESSMETTRGKVRTGLEGPGLTFALKIWYCVATVGGQWPVYSRYLLFADGVILSRGRWHVGLGF